VDTSQILEVLKELTLDFVNNKRGRQETVRLLHERIDQNDIYKLDKTESQRDFITEVFVSLDNLTNTEFAPSIEEMEYFAECFEGKRLFYQPEVRKFAVGSFDDEDNK
jgi:hypothetical protein